MALSGQLPYAVPVVAALGGSIATSALGELRQWRQQKQELRDLREGFRAELIHLQDIPQNLQEVADEGEISYEEAHGFSVAEFPYFKANQDQLHRLSNVEQIRLTTVYGKLHLMQEMFGMVRKQSLDPDSEVIAGMTGLKEIATEFDEERRGALKAIEDNL